MIANTSTPHPPPKAPHPNPLPIQLHNNLTPYLSNLYSIPHPILTSSPSLPTRTQPPPPIPSQTPPPNPPSHQLDKTAPHPSNHPPTNSTQPHPYPSPPNPDQSIPSTFRPRPQTSQPACSPSADIFAEKPCVDCDAENACEDLFDEKRDLADVGVRRQRMHVEKSGLAAGRQAVMMLSFVSTEAQSLTAVVSPGMGGRGGEG